MAYKKIDQQDLNFLATILSPDKILTGNKIGHDFGHDELGTISVLPEVVLMVKTAEEISAILKYANQNLIPVTVRGSGTGLVGACVPLEGGILLDITSMNQILELDEANLTLTVEPGVLLMDIAEYVEPKGYFYAPDPGEKTATIGGNIATNAGGMRAVKYGTTRDWVVALEVVLPNGEIITCGRKVVKDSTGYSLKHLIIGSEGTLAIITKAVLKLIPLPTQSISLLVPFETLEKGIEAVPKIIQAKVSPVAIEFFERQTLVFSEQFLGKKFPDSSSDAYLLLTFDAMSNQELNTYYTAAAELCLNELGAKDVLIVDTNERKEAVWKARGAFLEAIKASTPKMDECDVVVPRSQIADFIKFTYELSNKYQVRIPSFGHAGDGNLHIYICQDQMPTERFEEVLELVFEEMYQRAKEVGGLVSGEHGVGFAKIKYAQQLLGDPTIMIMKGIKQAFDPNNILNPGKVIKL